MSIIGGLEATIRLLRKRIEDNKAGYINRLSHHINRNRGLMKQNDELADRIHLDLDPRVKRQNRQIDSLTDDLESLKAECSKLENDCRSYNVELGNLKRKLQGEENFVSRLVRERAELVKTVEENYVSRMVGDRAELVKTVERQGEALLKQHAIIDAIEEALR